VVVVSDAASYLSAISRWTPALRFPVLIDDGSPAAREDIARFVRAYRPQRVLRWSAPEAEGAPIGAAGFNAVNPAELRRAVARAWSIDADENAPLLAAWKERGHEPPGLVVAGAKDPAWTAALALAAGRGQPVVFIDTVRNVDWAFTTPEADAFARAVEEACGPLGLPWRGLGDAIDAVTLCVHTPVRVDAGKNIHHATTDRIGRLGSGADTKERWAWAGQVFGTAAASAYRAMSALFLQPSRAWIFDGYPNSGSWAKYDGTAAAKVFTEAGLPTDIIDAPKASLRDWRLAAARPLAADLILINSKGNADFFDLEPGRAAPGDVPLLNHPAAVHMVHSWSAFVPTNRGTVGGRWLDHGAFAYAGSVQEPFLSAFIETPKLAQRLASGAPWGVACRHDAGPVWKVAIIGDPLYTLGRAQTRAAQGPDLAGATVVGANLRKDLADRKYAETLEALVLTGRDADASRLAAAVLADDPKGFTPAVARAAVPALARAGENRLVVDAFARLGPHAGEPLLLDALWLSAFPLLERGEAAVLPVLRANLRKEQPGHDAAVLAAGWAKAHDRGSAEAMLREVRADISDAAALTAFDKAVREAPDGWRP